MRGDDGHREQVWNKRGSRFQVPRVPRPSLKTLLKALPGIGILSLSLVGFLAVPAGSPPPPPAVTGGPIATVEPTPTATEIATDPNPVEQPSPEPLPPCHPKGTGGSALPPSRGGDVARYILYSNEGSVGLFNVATNSRTVLIRHDPNCDYVIPHFVDRRTVLFADRNQLKSLDIVTGSIRPLKTYLETRDLQNMWLTDFDVDQNATTLAATGGDGGNTFKLAVSTLRSGKLLFSKRLGFVCGCDGLMTPTIVQWSRDGSLLLVGVPSPQETGLIYVFDRAGKQVVTPMKGGSPRWLGAAHSFIYDASGISGSWTRFDIATRKHEALIKFRTAFLPVVSPTATKIAFTDDVKMRIVVYDLLHRTLRTLAGNHAFPLWLDDDRLAVSAVASCNCEYPAFQGTGTVGSVSLSSGRTVRMKLQETYGVDVWY